MKVISSIKFESLSEPGKNWVEITSNSLFEKDGRPARNGVLDLRLGSLHNFKCQTCGQRNCTGHFGYIRLPHKENSYITNPLLKTSMSFLPVMPTPSRHIVIEDGEIVLDDLTLTYVTILNIIHKYKATTPNDMPWIIWEDYKNLLQFYVDILFENKKGYTKKVSGEPYKGIIDMMKGKNGHIRNSCLGKRTMSMARSVFTVDPHLLIDQIGVPQELVDMDALYTQDKYSKEILENNHCYEIVDKETKIRYNPQYFHQIKEDDKYYVIRRIKDGDWVMMNRAPSLHKYSILAFKAVIMPGKTIRLNPMCCAPFNADCDGDAVNIIVPQTDEVKWECEHLISANKNIKSVRHGKNIIGPAQDYKVAAYLTGVNLKDLDTPEKINAFGQQVPDILRPEALTFSKEHMLLITTRADARGNLEQYKQMWERGLEHEVQCAPKNITGFRGPRESYRKGLSPLHFWEAAHEGRMSMIHRSISPASTGYMERKLIFCCGDLQWNGECVIDSMGRIISEIDFSDMAVGTYVGILCAQTFGELSTQTVLRSFHRPGEVNVSVFDELEKYLLKRTGLSKTSYIEQLTKLLESEGIAIDSRWVQLMADIKYVSEEESTLSWGYVRNNKAPLHSLGFERVKQNLERIIGKEDNLSSPFSQVMVGVYKPAYRKSDYETEMISNEN